jgi:hypothetical protein
MTRRSLLMIAMLVLWMSTTALAAGISGTWTGTLQMGDNAIPLTFTFKAAGEKLAGTVSTPDTGELPLSDGKLSGDKFSFWVTADSTKYSVAGTVKGEELAVQVRADNGMDFPPMVLKRAK